MQSFRLIAVLLCLFAVSSAAAQATDYTSWARFQAGLHPDYVSDDSLDIHMAWCVWHEGVPIYRDSLPIDGFRRACMAMQSHNSTARRIVEHASNNELYAAIERMQNYFGNPNNGGYKMLEYHLTWVLNHEGRRDDVLRLLDAGDFPGIRSVYESEQEHNPHVHHLIQAADNATISRLVNSMR